MLYEGTDFTAEKTFDSADAGSHTVTVKLTLIGEASNKYKLRDGEDEFTISGTINKAVPHPTVSISKAVCATDEKLLPLLSIEGVQEDAVVTYYYTPPESSIYYDDLASLNKEINEDTVIDEPGTYYIFARTAATKNYEAAASEEVMLIVSNDVASVVSADGSGDRVLNLNNHSITGGGMINAGRGGNEGYLTITGGGDVKTEIVVNDGCLTLNNFSGTITTVTIDSGSISSDAGTAGRIGTLKLENQSSRGFLCGGMIGTIEAYSEEPTAEKLLAQGYVFRNADGYVDKTTPTDGLTEVTVVVCDHNGENGFDINSTACPYCGAPAVVYTQLNLPESAGNS